MSSLNHKSRGCFALRAAVLESLESRQLMSVSADGDISEYRTALRTWSEPGQFLTAPAATVSEAMTAALVAMKAHTAQVGLSSGDLTSYRVADQYTDADTGTTHVYLRQQYNGLDIADADLNFNLDKEGRLINVGSSFVSDLKLKATASTFRAQTLMPVTDALTYTARALGLSMLGAPVVTTGLSQLKSTGASAPTSLSSPGVSLDAIPAKLQYVMTETGLKLAWNFVIRTPDGNHWYDLATDGQTGELIRGADWVEHASYNVLPRQTESPSHGSRQVLTNPQDTTASPFGWHDTNGAGGAEFTDTRGNNVDAHTDLNDDDTVGAGEATRPAGGSGLTFNNSLDLSKDPSAYQQAAMTQLFYANNTAHDIHYKYGFTEAAGNFQVNNYGKGGSGGDGVQADAQDGGNFRDSNHINNANFGTPPDGQVPRMQMYIFNNTTPNRDGDFDNGVMFHEYGHGVSTRLTGGPANSNALDGTQSGGMGEGWSDFWALMFTQVSTDTINQAYPMGTYVEGQSPTGSGIRRKPYSYNMAVNNQTFGLYNSSQEVHNSGELWASALWDMNWLLIQKYGFTSNIAGGYNSASPTGNTLALKLVMDGLKLQPANPRFTDARNAILNADLALTGGKNQNEIWTAFARRGLGYSANAGSTANSTTLTEAFDIPSNSSISGTVFKDANGNAVKDSGEAGIGNVRVYVDSNGNNAFDAGTTPTSQTHSNTTPVTIPDTQTITSSLAVSGRTGVITDVNVKINITHSAVQDLIVTLIAPNGKRVVLANRVGGTTAQANFSNTVFDDSASTPIANGSGPYTGTFKPSSTLSALNAGAANGTWKLEVSDNDVNDSGKLNNWSITLSTGVIGEKSTLTSSSGGYTLGSLPAGSYKVRQVVPTGYAQTLPTSNGSQTVALGTNKAITGKDFGDKPNLGGTISGNVFYDGNGNAAKDSGEANLAGWTVFLDANNNGAYDAGTKSTKSFTGLPATIPDGGTLTKSLSVGSLTGNVLDLDVQMSITHPFVGDLQATLTGPTGTKITLFSNVGGPGDNFSSTVFNDEAANPVNKGSAPFTANFKPAQGLSAFDGKVMNGTWTLAVSDTSLGDKGSLAAFSLIFTTSAGERTVQTDTSGNYQFTNVNAGTYHVREILQSGFTRTTPSSGVYDVTLATNGASTGKNFGNKPNSFSLVSTPAPSLFAPPRDSGTAISSLTDTDDLL